MQFRLRTLLIAVTAVACCLGFAVWWTSPYIERNKPWHGDGEKEQFWYQRTLFGESVHVKTIRHYSFGKIEARADKEDPRIFTERYWLNNGREVSQEEFFAAEEPK